MRLSFSVLPLVFGSALLLALGQFARACECAPPPPPCQAIGASSLVFLGTVLAIDGEGIKTAKMRVDQSFKDPLPAEVELFDSGMCDGPHFIVGRQYLMYTNRMPDGAIPARGCTRSRAVEAASEDLQFLRSYLAGETMTRIYGTVRYRPDEPDDDRNGTAGRTPMEDVTVNVSGAGRSFHAKTDANGRYSVSRLPPGQYEIDAELPGYRTNGAIGELQLAPRGCAVADVLMNVDRRVQGTVRSDDGRPVAGVLVEMVSTNRGSKRWQDPILLDVSDENGSYTIDSIPPGDYYLGINIRSTPKKDYPYAPTYYPNTHDVKTATRILFSAGASTVSYDLTAPAKLRVIRVRGRILDNAGAPAKDGARIRIKEPGLNGQIEDQELPVNDEGRFEVELCEGERYSAFAFSGFRTNTYSEPIEFMAGDSELRFVLNKTAEEFRELSKKFQDKH